MIFNYPHFLLAFLIGISFAIAPSRSAASGVDGNAVREFEKIENARGAVISSILDLKYPIKQDYSEEDVKIETHNIRLESGDRATLVIGWPRKAKQVPAVFIIDVESTSLAQLTSRRISWGGRKQEMKLKRLRYLRHSPFGSNLLAQGYMVAYLVADDVKSLRSARLIDWLEAFDTVKHSRNADPNSFFLFSTKEYANLSLYLASKYDFSGFVLEEPAYALFTAKTYAGTIAVSNRLTPAEIWKRIDSRTAASYARIFSEIDAPIMLIRSEDSPALDFNEKTLIAKLKESRVEFESISIPRQARVLKSFGGGLSGVMDESPIIKYYIPSVSFWLEHMIPYLEVNSHSLPAALDSLAFSH